MIFRSTEAKINDKYDTGNLRIEADYDIEVDDDVYWVPVNQLGTSRYTKDQISDLRTLSPEEKQARILTLFEAIQLYQLSNFRGIIDNVKHMHNGICWEYHKPGFHAVRTNEGCCAANSNWLSYILHGKYEQMGFLYFSQRDRNGHIMNFIFHNGWYYFIDMMMYRTDSLPFAGIESGTQSGYKDNELISGNFFKSRTPMSYVNFCLNKHKDTPVLFTISLEKEVFAMAADGIPNAFDIIHPKHTDMVELYRAAGFPLILRFEEPPVCNCGWNEIPSEIFTS